MTTKTIYAHTWGGVRPIDPALRCPYCGAFITRWCQAKKVWKWGPVTVEFSHAICRSPKCREAAVREGWIL